MGWVKLDDGFADHPKIDNLSDGAFRLWAAALGYVARNLTDGVVPEARLPRLVPRYKPALLAELLADDYGPVWHRPGHGCDRCPQPPAGHITVHDYLDKNPTGDEERERRRKRAEAGRIGGKRSGEARQNEAKARALAEAHASFNGSGTVEPRPVPSPSPSPSTPTHDVGTAHPSSSSPRPDDDDRNRTLAETWAILAQRDLERRNAETSAKGVDPIAAPARRKAWLATAETRCAEAFQPLAERFLAGTPDLEPRQLADLLDDPIGAAIADSPLGRGHS